MANEDGGAQRGAGPEGPAPKEISGEERSAEGPHNDVCGGAGVEVRLAEEAVFQYLTDETPGRRSWLRSAVLKWAGAVLLSGTVLYGYCDLNDGDDVGCTVAQQPGGCRRRVHVRRSQQNPRGKVPVSGGSGAGAGGPGDDGDFVQPECLVRAEACGFRLPDGICRIRRKACWAVAWDVEVRNSEFGVRSAPGGRPANSQSLIADSEGVEGRSERSEVRSPLTPDVFAGASSHSLNFGAAKVVEMLAGIHREIASVRSEFVEVRGAKERLEKMLADGLFAFTRRVDATSFKILCTILADGDVAKASRTLRMPDASVRNVLRRWRSLGKEYRAMLDLVRWRKAVGRKETVPLNDNLLLGKAESADYPGLLADVLEGLMEMTDENWSEKAVRLEVMLRAAVSGG